MSLQERPSDPVQGAFRALADPTRRKILQKLERRDMTIAEVADGFDMTRAAVKKHLTILAEGELISVTRRGRAAVNRLEPAGFKRAADWLTYFDRFWDDRLGDLKPRSNNMERTPMTDAMPDLVKTAWFAAPRETVWAFLTEADKLGKWFHPAEADLAAGADYALIAAGEDGRPVRQCWGTVLEMDPPARLSYTFTIKPLAGAMTTVTWRLEEAEDGTKLTLEHDGISAAAGAAALGLLTALDKGWDVYLDALRDAVK